MKKKNILISLCAFSAIIGTGCIWLVLHLNNRVNNSLEKGWFTPPIEYYTAPEKINVGMYLPPSRLIKKLKERYYSQVSHQKQISPGHFKIENCSHLNSEVTPEYCLSWQDTDTKIYFTIGLIENKVSLLKEDQRPAEFIFLKPFLFAQYENEQPILKQFKNKISAFPFYCLQAALAAEDHQFITHEGISFKAIIRALWRNIRAGRLVEGGSTITQQLIKNIFFNHKKSFWRKFQEQIMALLLEQKLSKDQILMAYLNIVYMGQSGVFRIHGFGSAAEYYINKPLSQLNLSECALLAGLIKSPGRYKPSTDNKKILNRRNYILDTLHKKQIINKEELTTAKVKPIIVHKKKFSTPIYFTDTIYKQMKQLNLPMKKGLKVFTTLFPDLQQKADVSLQAGLKWIENKRLKKELKEKSLQAVLINVDISTGAVRAIIGGRSFKESQFNRAIQAKRQVGSLMKPVVVLAAMIEDKELNPLSIIKDTKFTHKYDTHIWSPKNYKNDYRGSVFLYEALGFSLNSAIARLGLKTGLELIANTLKLLGGPPLIKAHPSLILGAIEMSPWQASQIFLTIARMGDFKKQYIIEKITDLKGKTLYEYEQREQKEEIDPKKIAVLLGMLKEVAKSGTARWLKNFPGPMAGKTGTTNEEKDAWFVGFTPETLTLTWLGFDNNQSHHLTGAEGALPLWEVFMRKILPSLSHRDFSWPKGVMNRNIPPYKKESEKDQEVSLIFEE